LLLLTLFAMGYSASADRASSETLAQRLSGSVDGLEVHPVWAPDDSALYIHEADQILRIDTATGHGRPMIDFEAMAQRAGGKSPRIERFAIADNGDFICLVETGNNYATLRIDGSKIDPVAPEDDPFALTPLSRDHDVNSDETGSETAIIFINNTDKPVQLFWADSGTAPQPYSTIEPHTCHRQHTYAGHAWLAGSLAFIAIDEPAIAYLGSTPQEPDQQECEEPTNEWEPGFRDQNLFVRNRKTGEGTALTSDGTADGFYCGPTFVSPDGRYLVAVHETPGDNRTIDLIEAAPDDRLQPRTVSIPYPKPGDRIAIRKPCLFDLQTMKQIPIEDALFSNPWDIDAFHWAPDSRQLYFVYNERGHQTARLLAVQAETGKVTVLAEDRSDTFIDWTNKLQVHHLDKTDEVLWMSERSGWNHLYLVDRKTGSVQPITSGQWVVRSIEQVDEDKREILFRACGVFPGMDPYYVQYGRISFDGSNLTWLTEGNGTHTLSISPNNGFFVDSWSRIDQPPVHELRHYADGKLVNVLNKADASRLLKIHPHLPEPFCAKGRDGKTDIYGVIYRPSDFDPDRKYPVIEDIYAGPQDFFVPKAFKPYHNDQRLAELGFIVVQIDGMGTNWRSKKFHDVCWKNLKDAGLPDRIAWIRAAAEKYPCMDLDRVGIFGTSAGGQSALRAVIDHADFYKAAAADCGCHDNRMDKIWWNEQWMGWPVDESYAENSNVVDAHKLGGKLLLTVGAMDSNVDPSSTMQVVDELIKADKDFELMVFPSAGHGAGTRGYGIRLREDFFIRHLQ